MNSRRLNVQLYVLVSSPGKTGFATFQVGHPIGIFLPPGASKAIEQAVTIPEEVPDGFSVCVQVSVREKGDPFSPFSGLSFCMKKGGPIPPVEVKVEEVNPLTLPH